VTLSIVCNAPPIDAAAPPGPRPVQGLAVTQTVDLRPAQRGAKDGEITLEVRAAAAASFPSSTSSSPASRRALPGYRLKADGVRARPYSVIQPEDRTGGMRGMFAMNTGGPPTDGLRHARRAGGLPARDRALVGAHVRADGAPVGASFELPACTTASPHDHGEAVRGHGQSSR
jgi:hypothetical protein